MFLEITNSFCELKGAIPANVSDLVTRVLTYENDIFPEVERLTFAMRWAKKQNDQKKYNQLQGQIKKLEATKTVCWFKKNKFPTGHLNIVKACLDRLKTPYEINDLRIIPDQDVMYKWNNRPHKPRYYQDEVHEICKNSSRGVIESAVGTGKSLMQGYLIKEFNVVSLVVVPSSGLSAQIYEDFRSWFGSQYIEIIDTKKIRSGKKLKPIRIVTIQSLASLQKSGDIQDLVGDVNLIICDEIHHAGSSSYTNLLPEIAHIYYRFGFTGTFLRNDSKSLDMWGFLSNVLYRYSAKQAIDDGFLTPFTTKIHRIPGVMSRAYPKEYKSNYCASPDFLAKVGEICVESPFDQILILVSRKDQGGALIHDYLQMMGIDSTFISGDNSKEEITESIKAFNNKDIRVLIGSQVIGEGIDVRSTDHLLLCQGGKSEIAIVQAIGRLVRLFEGKKSGTLHDFDFTGTKYMVKHQKIRLDIIKRNFAPKQITAV